MKVLFIGGTGIISSACSELALEKGFDLWHLNRGLSREIRKTERVKTLVADIRDERAVRQVLGEEKFDVLVNWLGFLPAHIEQDIRIFAGKIEHYIFISSASAYQTPPEKLPVTEETPLGNPFWQYSRHKIACERFLESEGKKSSFPYTIVRPSHTYDKTSIPILGKWTTLHRMKNNLPVVVAGDGTSLWTLTHHRDFAVGLVGLLGKKESINEAYHITSDEWLSWNQIYQHLGKALAVSPQLIPVPSIKIAEYDQEIGDGLLGDKTHSMIFDNNKIKRMVTEFNPEIPFSQGAQEIVAWYEADKSRQIIDPEMDKLFNTLIKKYA